jgi:hypothetical protein
MRHYFVSCSECSCKQFYVLISKFAVNIRAVRPVYFSLRPSISADLNGPLFYEHFQRENLGRGECSVRNMLYYSYMV